MSTPPDPQAAAGSVQPRLAAEFPGLELRWVVLETRDGPSPPPLRERLRELSDRARGARVLALRTQPIAHAYRVFFRQTGLDPDVTRIPSEEAAVRRLLDGGFRSRGRIHDALLIALVETGVPVWALDHEVTDPETLTIRTSQAGEAVGGSLVALAEGQLVLADAQRVHGALFGPLAPVHTPGPRARGLVLACVGVDGVPSIFLEEALWLCTEILTDS